MDSALQSTLAPEPAANNMQFQHASSDPREAPLQADAAPLRGRRARMRLGEDASGRLQSELTSRIGVSRYRRWFGQAQVQVQEQQVIVMAQTPFAAKWIDAQFGVALRQAASHALGRETTVKISVAPEAAAVERADIEDGSSHARAATARGRGHGDSASDSDKHSAVSLDPAPRLAHVNGVGPVAPRAPRLHDLNDFVIGDSNRLAHSAATRLAEGEELLGVSPLFIHGECGVGKTHLLQGICKRFIERRGGTGLAADGAGRVRYVTGEQFTNEFIAAIRTNTLESFRSRVRRLALLAIDDVHFLANKFKTQSEFQCTLDAIDFGGARVVMASDNHPHHIKRFNQSLVNRFVSGLVVRIERPDRALRCELIRRVAQRRGMRLGEAAIDELAAQGGASVREIEGAMTRLAAWRDVVNPHAASDEVGLLLVQQVLRDDRQRPNHVVRIATVIDAVCQRLSVSKSDLMGASRHRRVVLGRSMVAYLARELTTLSFPEVAQALGRDNHSTVHTADQRLRRQLQNDERMELGVPDAPASLRELADLLRREICRAGT